jgi:nucleoside-diphosphate kinase
MKMAQLSDDVINEHYAHLLDKPFFPSIKGYMTRTPVVIIAVRGKNAVASIRTFIGATNPTEALM